MLDAWAKVSFSLSTMMPLGPPVTVGAFAAVSVKPPTNPPVPVTLETLTLKLYTVLCKCPVGLKTANP